MAKRKSRKTGGSRKGKSRKGGGKRRRRSGGGGRKHMANPSMQAVWMAGALVGGEVVADTVLTKDGDPMLPDFVNPKALALWSYGYWYGQPIVQQVAYALELDHLADEQGLTEKLKEQVEKLLGRSSGPSASNEEEGEPGSEEDTTGDVVGMLSDITNALEQESEEEAVG